MCSTSTAAASALDERDRRFATELVYGTTRRRRACDALIDRFIMSEPEPRLRTLLRLGAYQLEFADVAPHAAVSETVSLAPRRARPFVNAVLRRVAGTAMTWSCDAERLSYPDWIVERLSAELGPLDAVASLEAMDVAPGATERDDGYTQDLASQWVAAAVPVSHGDVVLDLCAAPGGKATALAAAGATVVACDVRPHRAALVASNAALLGASSLAVVVSDATTPPFAPGSVDAVLLDAPCSGLGTLRRRADARWRISAGDVDQLVQLQQHMIQASAPLVRVGGMFVYSVCTLTAAESIDHHMPSFLEPITDPPDVGTWRSYGPGWRVLPHDAGTDGMVLLRYRRTS